MTPDGNVEINGATGRPVTVTGPAKADQDLRQLITLAQQSDGTYAGLDDVLGRVPESTAALSSAIQRRVRQAFARLQQLQNQSGRAQRTDDEVFSRIARMFVIEATIDGVQSKTGYLLRVEALTLDGERRLTQVGLVG